VTRLLVTGGTGYLGAELVRRAAGDPQWSVAATYHDRLPRSDVVDPASVDWFEMELRDDASVERAVRASGPDVVIHTAFVQQGEHVDDVTAHGARRVAQATTAAAARLIHLSTDVVFSGETDAPYTEDDPVSPVHVYGRAKADAEGLVLAADRAAVIVRTSLLYGGPFGPTGPQERLVADAVAGRSDVTFFTDELRNPVQVGELSASLLELALLAGAGLAGGPLHLVGDDVVSRFELALLLGRAAGLDVSRLRGGEAGTVAPLRPRRCVLDNARMRDLLANRLRGVREVLGAIS
jgi:dTDP-4-dehydrorhamnose reductase